MGSPQALAFDVGPLTWVKTEIDHSLAEARQNLDKVAADPRDAKSVKYVATHLHQVSGALSMVGLGAATRFNEEIEKAVSALEGANANTAALVAVAKKAIGVLSGYLDSLIAGQRERPMSLAPVYVELNRTRGASDAALSDLFHPDLSASPPPPEDTVVIPSHEMLQESLRQRRALFQAGLLKLLKEKEYAVGLRAMRDSVIGIETLQLHTPSRTFWLTASAFFDAVAHNPRELGGIAVALLGKIDQQIKLVQDGIQKVPERLFRDLLLIIGKSTAQTERIRQVRDLYRLDDLLAAPEALKSVHGDDEELKAVVREMRDLTQSLKDGWLKFTSGNHAAIDTFAKLGEAALRTASRQPNAELGAVFRALALVGESLRATDMPCSENLALEVATALLFTEQSLEKYFTHSADFAALAKNVAARVVATASGTVPPALDPRSAGLMDAMTRRAQEHLLTFQVGQEVQVNLQSIEQVLDAYFRDPLKTGQLPELAALFAQAQGALTILELDEAAALIQRVSQRVGQFASGARKGVGDDAEAVAEGVSAIGLYVAALQQGESNPRDVLLPALVRFGLAEKPAVPRAARQAAMISEADLEVRKQRAQELYQEWQKQPEATHTRDQLRQVVGDLKRDAELVSDAVVARQSHAALSLLAKAEDPDATGLHAALQDIAPMAPAVPVAPPTPQSVQLLDKEGAEIDAELLEVFLEEAAEVIAAVRQNLATVLDTPQDRDALTTIRRGFHTLKGSGRMVGLTDLGEVAWQTEQVLNKWLKEEKPASPGLQQFIGLASDSFAGWVAELKASGTTRVDGTEITRLADDFKNGREPQFAAPGAPVAISAEAEDTALPSLDLTPAEAAAPPASVEVSQPRAEEEVQIGGVLVPAALYAIYLGEANQHIVTLNREIRELEANPLAEVSHEFMRAAHTLNSSSRTTGFLKVAEVAFALEKWLQAAIELPPHFDAHRLDVTHRAVDALTMMVDDLVERNAPLPRDDIVEELDALRSGLSEARRTGEGTHVRIPHMFEVDAATPPPGFADHLIPVPPAALSAAEPPAVLSATASAAPAPELAAIETGEARALKTLSTAPGVAGEAPTEAFEAGKEKRRIQDDVDADLLPTFLDEAREIVPQVGNTLRVWRAHPLDHAPVMDLARLLHTLKGGARMAGLMRLGELAHVIETRIIAMDGEATPGPARFDEIDDVFDRFTASLDRLQKGEDMGEPVEIPVTEVYEQQKDKPGAIAVLAAAAQAVREEITLDGRERHALLRVNADLIDRFVNEAGELAIARSRIDIELVAFKRALQELADNVTRMKQQLREIEIDAETQIQSQIKERDAHGAFDPLEFDRFTRMHEVTRFLAESLNDVVTLQQGLQKNIDESDAALHQQGRLNHDLQQGLMSVRLVPLGNLQDRLYRVVRQTAKELGKKANLEFRGARVELDRSVLEKITAPFEHLLRNAISHGIETPVERTAKGKSEIGEIVIDANQVGNEIVLRFSDDGAGLDYARIRSKAIESGLLDAHAEIPDEEAVQFIFLPGFSTASEVTQISGRGVGMDVVKSEIVSLGGRIEIGAGTGAGTVFTITLPLTLAVTQAVMVKIGAELLAIPSVMVEQVQEYKGKRYDALLAMTEIDWKGNRYPLRSLDALLGGRPTASAQKTAAVILARSASLRAAVQVDEIVGNREIVVKPIGPQLARLPGIAGATVLGNGQVVLIVNPVQLVFRDKTTLAVERGSEEAAAPRPGPHAIVGALGGQHAAVSEAMPVSATVPLVMVVDDSLTVRKITGRMLTREGFEVATAKDGVDGLKQLQDLQPAVILLDIEMPRMDGFEFARNVRADPKTRGIPIIMITSRTADKHRNRAFELGVNEYMGKPYQEEQLLALIRSFLGNAPTTVAA